MRKYVRSISDYMSVHKFLDYIKEMNKTPLSYLLYAFSSIFIILLITTTINFSNFVAGGFYDSTSSTQLLESFHNYILLMIGLIALYLISDALATHVSYIQFKYYYTDLSVKQKFKLGLKLFPSYIFQKLIQFYYTLFPIIIGLIFLLILSSILLNTAQTQNVDTTTVIVGLLMLLVIILSILVSVYYTIKYTYLSVFIYFTDSNELMQIKDYRLNIKNRFISILIRIVILFLIISVLQLLTQLYNYLTSFIAIDVVTLVFQIGGVFISTFISYFSTAYLYLTFKEEMELEKTSSK
ncbi:MAG: hypothetical protein ACLFPL_00570 [Candidatus Nanoarchaeia archaeon]